jgi:hypothetical protein
VQNYLPICAIKKKIWIFSWGKKTPNFPILNNLKRKKKKKKNPRGGKFTLISCKAKTRKINQ